MRRTHPKNKRYINDLVQLQRGTIEIVVIAIVLALGINLISSGIPQLLHSSGIATISAGLALIAFAVFHLAMKAKPALSHSITLSGILPIGGGGGGGGGGEVIELPRYEFGEKIHSYIRALTTENRAMGRIWQRARFGVFDEDISTAQKRAEEEGNRIVREAIEYFALTKLSLHLSSYFASDRSVRNHNVTTIQRRNIPQLLLDNRFLELFSKPMKERTAFHVYGTEEDGDDRTVVFATGENGELFTQFELILPAGTVLSRTDDGALSIETVRFKLVITPVFDRFSTNFPRDFSELYLGLSFLDVHALVVSLNVDVSFSWRSFTTRNGWDYYEWLDSFLEELEESFSFEEFVERIGWQAAHTTAIVEKNGARASNTPQPLH